MTEKAVKEAPVPNGGPAPSHITHYPAWCKRCGICIAFCPKTVFDTAPDGAPIVARPQDCIRCHMCELRCPDFALSVADEEDRP
ncbi:MAG: hypothetical protein Kow0092_11800 [Deferrisomatales bacterium]